jgi:hypothetical protein
VSSWSLVILLNGCNVRCLICKLYGCELLLSCERSDVSCRGEACSDNIGGGLFGMNLSVNLVLGLCRSLNCAPSSGLPPDLWDVASLPHPNLANPAVPHGCGWMELEQMVGWRQSLVARVDGAQVWWRVMDGWQRSSIEHGDAADDFGVSMGKLLNQVFHLSPQTVWAPPI